LKQWQEIARLGQRIVHELDLQNTNKVLGRWMAHRVAELMQSVETTTDPIAKEAAERECQDLIIRLWGIRDKWPSGGPLHALMPTLQILLADVPVYHSWFRRVEQDDASGLLTRLLRLQRQELAQIYQLIRDRVPTEVIESMQQLLDEHHADLSEAENHLISFVIHPSKIPLFNSEEDAETYDEEKVIVEGEDDGEVLGDSTNTPVDSFTEFRESIELKRQEFFNAVARVLAVDSSSTPQDF